MQAWRQSPKACMGFAVFIGGVAASTETYPTGYNCHVEVLMYRSAGGRSPVEECIEGLAKSDQVRFAEVADGIERHGLECPRVIFRQLEGKLWEIKFGTATGRFRVAYVVIDRDRMVWLHVFKKQSQRTPQNDLQIARRRMKEVLGA